MRGVRGWSFFAVVLLASCAREVADTQIETEEDRRIFAGAEERIEKYRKGDMTLELVDAEGRALEAGVKVVIEQVRHEFLFGSTIFALGEWETAEENQRYEELFSGLLNYATLPFYWWRYEVERGAPRYEQTEEYVRWCKANNITCKGHPLASNGTDSDWFTDQTPIVDLQVAAVADRVRRFKGDIHIWDVVNEMAGYDIPRQWKAAPRFTAAIEEIGVGEFVRRCFAAAREADPEATLIINDYILDARYEDVIEALIDEDGEAMFDAIGMQSHQHGRAYSAAKTWEMCQRFSRFGKPLHFTETTFVSGKLAWPPDMAGKEWPSTPEGEKRQAEYAARFYTLVFSHPQVEAITWWAFSAGRHNARALLNPDATGKPAYYELKRLIKEKWWTKTEATVGEGGKVQFRGFFGDYKVVATVGGEKLSGTFKLGKKEVRSATVRLERRVYAD